MSDPMRGFLLRIPSISLNWFSVYAKDEKDAIDVICDLIDKNKVGSAEYRQYDNLWQVVEVTITGPGWYRKDGEIVLSNDEEVPCE